MEEPTTTGGVNSGAEGQIETDAKATETTSTDGQKVEQDPNLDSSKSTKTTGEDDKSDSSASKEDDASVSFDDDLDDWAEKTGRGKPETDKERKAFQEIRNSQRDYSRAKQSKESLKDLSKSISDTNPTAKQSAENDDLDIDPIESRVKSAEEKVTEERNLRLRSEFFSEKSVTPDESKVMGDILTEKVAKGGRRAFEYWTDPDNLEDWHSLARARIAATTDTSSVAEDAARQERERIAKESKASSPGRNAKAITTADNKSEEAKRLERFSTW